MGQPAAQLILPAWNQPDEETFTPQMTASLLSQILEDLSLAERVERALHATGYGMLRGVEVFVSARIVHLVGRVPSYYMKQIAQMTALATPGTHQIHNDLEVIQQN